MASGKVTELKGGEQAPIQKDINAFLNEYKRICKKYQLSIGHDERYGTTIIDYVEEYRAYAIILGTEKCAYCGKEHNKSDMLFEQVLVNCTDVDAPMMEYTSRACWFCKGTDCAKLYKEVVKKHYCEC